MKYEETATRLKQVMAEKGFSQQRLADASGVSKSCISHYVNGKNVPDNFQAAKLAKVLDVAPEWLMALDEIQKYIVVENNLLQQTISKLTEDQKKRLLKYAELLAEES